MATSQNVNVARMFEAYGYRNAAKVKAIGEWIDAPDLDTPAGNECFVFSVGQEVIASGNGIIKAGVKLEIKDRQIVNGFCQYLAGGIWNKQEDLTVE